jgi:DNA-binding GntR family transcriptional regulator
VVDSAYWSLRRDIVSREIKPGEKLVEMALAGRYGVSRTPIREALRRLEQDGLVQRDGRRLRVRQHRPDEIIDIEDVRIVLEGSAARAAALRRTSLELSLISRAHEAMRGLREDDTAAQERFVWAFHELVWAASHSNTLVDLLSRLQVNLRRYPDDSLAHPGRWRQVLTNHERLVSAIREHRTGDAADIAAAHLTEARDIRLRGYSEQEVRGSLR